MNHIYFNSLEATQLPEIIQNAFLDEFERTHLRHLNDALYLILNYPLNKSEKHIICLKVVENKMTLYAPSQIESVLNHPQSLPDLLLRMIELYETQTRTIVNDVKEYEASMESLVQRSHILDLYGTSKEIIMIRSGVSSIEQILNTIVKSQVKGLYDEKHNSDYASVRIETQQITETLEMQEKMITSLMQSSESLFSNKLNETMKRLTSITLIFSLPIFITGFYGMNIEIPYQEHPYILLFILLGSTISTWLLTLYLHRKDLL